MMRAFDNANRAVYEKATSDPEVLGMGTTGYVLYSAATWRILYTQGIPARTCGMAEQSAS